MRAEFIEALSGKVSKLKVEQIATKVVESPELFTELYSLVKCEDGIVSWRAMWACLILSKQMPSLFYSKYNELKDKAMNTTNPGIQRLSLNILLHITKSDEIDLPLLDFCINSMTALDKTPACQAVCMKLAYKMCKDNQPELLNEIKLYLDNMETSYYTAAALCARRAILKEINKTRQ